MNTIQHYHPPQQDTSGDLNMVEQWLRKDPTRWVAGIAAGLFAGIITIAFSALLATALGVADPWFMVKMFASILIGESAMEFGFHLPAILVGFFFFELLSVLLGFIYSHFVYSNSFSALLPMGVVWAIFQWIFWWNLFMQSINQVLWTKVSPGAAFPVCLVFGISLTSVAFFDRAMRGSR